MKVHPIKPLVHLMVCVVFVSGLSFPTRAIEETNEADIPEAVAPPPNYKTQGFDNTRFFSPLAGEDWLTISVTGRREFISAIEPARTALVIIDLQQGCCKWGDALSSRDPRVGEEFTRRMYDVVLPNVARLLELFRKNDMLVIFTMLGQDDTFPGIILPDPERIKRKKEFIVSKYSPGAFATSAIDNVLRENGIATLLFTGTDTTACVLCSMIGAYDRTYQAILIEDACVGSRRELHDAVVNLWNYLGFVRTTDQVVNDYPWRAWTIQPSDSAPGTPLPTNDPLK